MQKQERKILVCYFITAIITKTHYAEWHLRNPIATNPIKPKLENFDIMGIRFNGKIFSMLWDILLPLDQIRWNDHSM